MSLVFRQMGVYLKTVAGVAMLVFLLVFLWANYGNQTNIWFFKTFSGPAQVSVNLVVFASIAAGAVLWWLVRWMVTLPGQWRTLRQDARRQDLPPEQDAGGK